MQVISVFRETVIGLTEKGGHCLREVTKVKNYGCYCTQGIFFYEFACLSHSYRSSLSA